MAVHSKGLLIDIARCIGCGACVANCQTVNGLPDTAAPFLRHDTWTIVEQPREGLFVRDLCRHCLEPACVSACPVAALNKTEAGPVVYDPSICLGCRYCMVSCQFKIPRFEWLSPNPRIRKCILCEPRLKEGMSTGCAEACPTEATVFGDRETLIAMAKARIAAEPDKYQDHIYGLEEVGGTAVIFISPVSFEEIGFNIGMGKYPLPELTWRVLQHVPATVLTGGILLSGSYWIFKRRADVKQAEAGIGKNRKDPGHG